MKRFEVGRTYSCTSICDSNCVWAYTVVRRTEKTVTLMDVGGKIQKNRIIKSISEYHNCEAVYPLGKYSMCPILSAE